MANDIIAPSILSADFANLEKEVKSVMEAGADWIHVDVMDGHFVPNLTIGAPVVKSLSKIQNAFLDVHLMIDTPERWVKDYIEAGAHLVTCHIEATKDIQSFIAPLKEAGRQVGISLKPNTPASSIKDILGQVDLVLVMTVEPGFGGQSFMENQLSKITEIKQWREEMNLDFHIEVDGGVSDKTIALCRDAGANAFVAGSFIFKKDYSEAIRVLRDS